VNPTHDQAEAYRPASQINPGWHVRVDETWLAVDMAIETETIDGSRYITFAFTNPRRPAVKVHKTARVMSRPPERHPETKGGEANG
jgi:hypothetical protein